MPQVPMKMFLGSLTLLLSIVGAIGNDCLSACNPRETCCPGPTKEPTCCPFSNAICCDDGIHCCPEGSFCDMEVRMCGAYTESRVMRKRFGEIEEEIPTGSIETHREKRDNQYDLDDKNEISNVNHMLVHCDLDEFCPFSSTCCHNKELNIYFCCPNSYGVCCPDEMHCCQQGEECDSEGKFCLSEIGLQTEVRRADDLIVHYRKEHLDYIDEVLEFE